MKIAVISPFQLQLHRGIERFHWSLAAEFAKRGAHVDLFTCDHPNPVDWGSIPVNVRVRKVPYVRFYMSQWAAFFYSLWLTREQYDWVIVAFANYGEAQALRRVRSPRVCLILHYPHEQVPHRYVEFIQTGLATRAEVCVGVSTHVAKSAERILNRPCHMVHNGVDVEVFRPNEALRSEMRSRFNLSSEARVLISTAALEERKGIQHIVRVMPSLLARIPELHYWVLGEGPYRTELEHLINQLALSDHVHLVGPTDDVTPYLSMADVGCLLSYGEALPISVLEYMAMELPCITSRQLPFPEIVRTDFGIMVDETMPQEIIWAIESLLTDEPKRQRMGKAGRQHAVTHYGWDRVCDRYLSLFNELEREAP